MSKALLVRSQKKKKKRKKELKSKKKERKTSKKSSERCQGFSEDEKKQNPRTWLKTTYKSPRR